MVSERVEAWFRDKKINKGYPESISYNQINQKRAKILREIQS